MFIVVVFVDNVGKFENLKKCIFYVIFRFVNIINRSCCDGYIEMIDWGNVW